MCLCAHSCVRMDSAKMRLTPDDLLLSEFLYLITHYGSDLAYSRYFFLNSQMCYNKI